MYAVIKTGGKQYKVTEGDVLRVEKLNAEVNTTRLTHNKGVQQPYISELHMEVLICTQ